MSQIKVGIGYDVHRLQEGRKLIIGGVEIPFEKGLEGHSDADVLVHAIMDAILGALGQGDIGHLFPDTDPAYKGADSMKLLEVVKERMETAGYELGNLDALLIAQRPKIAPYVPLMRTRIARGLGVEESLINVKATTEERLGFTGREEGMAAEAICLLEKR
ncbi:MAG: 2-C-methyl-D-erythritol 2,4-cyclodiphosphate synthase [Lachnospiraceae bacterium]|nr:2-C-methyl-D-erythritol 2,4-cyclodiphosphate synthase [Lachnospiraceae bacterium]